MRHAIAHLCAVVAAGGALLSLFAVGVVRARAAGVALALITLVELVVIGRANLQPRPHDWAAGTERFTAVDWLVAKHPRDRFVPDAHGPFRLHNVGMTLGMEGASGYGSVEIWRYVNFLYVLNTGRPYPWTQLRDDPAASDVKRFDTPLVDLLNVRWAIATQSPPGWIERFAPPVGAPPHAVHEPTWDPLLRVYENPHALPRAFVVYGARVLPDEGKQADALATLDPRATAIVDRAPDPPPIGDGRAYTEARLTVGERHYLRIEADAGAPGILVVSEVMYPGWSATLDGKPVPLLYADYAFRGVALPAGHHVVEMRFRSRPTEIGLWLSALGLVALIALGSLGRRRPSVL
jgi:hypothetical protein